MFGPHSGTQSRTAADIIPIYRKISSGWVVNLNDVIGPGISWVGCSGFVKTISGNGPGSGIGREVDCIGRVSPNHKVKNVVVADGIPAVLQSGSRRTQGEDDIEWSICISGIGDIVVVNGIAIVSGSSCGCTEIQDTPCWIQTGTFYAAILNCIGSCIVDKPHGAGSRR